MEMTIDEAIKQIIECKAYKQCDTEQDSEALDVAIETMHKYQKIQEIVEERNSKPPLTTLNRIIKVVEDGNVD